MDITPIRLARHVEQVAALTEGHYRETSVYAKTRPLMVDWGYFLRAEDAGHMGLIGVFDGERLVGYACFILSRSSFINNDVVAVCNQLYLLPEYRKGHTGAKLIKEIALLARVMKAVRVQFFIPWRQKRVTALMLRLGYSTYEASFVKDLIDG